MVLQLWLVPGVESKISAHMGQVDREVFYYLQAVYVIWSCEWPTLQAVYIITGINRLLISICAFSTE